MYNAVVKIHDLFSFFYLEYIHVTTFIHFCLKCDIAYAIVFNEEMFNHVVNYCNLRQWNFIHIKMSFNIVCLFIPHPRIDMVHITDAFHFFNIFFYSDIIHLVI